MPPMMADAATGPSAMEDNARGGPGGGGGPEQAQTQAMGAIRDLGQKLEALGKQIPGASGEIQQMRMLLRKIILKAGAKAPQQNESAGQLPTGG